MAAVLDALTLHLDDTYNNKAKYLFQPAKHTSGLAWFLGGCKDGSCAR